MKKLLNIVITLALVSSPTTMVMACSDKNMNYYNQFMSNIKNKENFIFMISAKNCINCQNTIDTTILNLYDKKNHGNYKYEQYLSGFFGSQYSLAINNVSLEQQEKIKNTRLIITHDVKDYKKVWKEKWAIKIIDWIIAQERNAHKINGKIDKTITAISLELNKTPTYIYIKNGNYVGFETGEVGNLESGANFSIWMNRFVKHIVLEDWDIPHNKL